MLVGVVCAAIYGSQRAKWRQTEGMKDARIDAFYVRATVPSAGAMHLNMINTGRGIALPAI